MNIAYFCDISSIHNLKWINYFSQNNEIIIITNKEYSNKKYYKKEKVKIYYLIPETYPVLRGFLAKKEILNTIKKIIIENKIDIIHSLYAVPYSFWAYKLGFSKHIITTRGSDVLIEYNKNFQTYTNLKERISKNILKKLFENTLNKARFVTSTSLGQQTVIKKFINDPNKLVLTRTGIDINFFISNFNKLTKTTSDNQVTILSPRLLKPIYNTHIIINAINSLVHDFSKTNFKLILIDHLSAPNYFALIIKQVKDLNLEKHVCILPSQDQLGMLQQYKNADVVVMIPESDGTPVSAIEAMLAHKPVILGNLDYDKDLFNEKTIWQLTSFSPDELAKTIMQLLDDLSINKVHKIQFAYENTLQLADINKTLSQLHQLYSVV